MDKLKTPVFLDLISDFAFKRVFGSEPNKELLIHFINQLFQGRKNIVDITYDKNEHMGDTEEMGTVILDLTCTGIDGEKFIIEVQTSPQVNFKRRMLYYGSKIISDQAPKGNRKQWNYGISEVYVIVLMDGFTFPSSHECERVLLDICLCQRDTGEIFHDEYGYIFVQLRNFTKSEEELSSYLDGWLFVLKNMSKLDKIPLYFRKPIFEKLFKLAEYSKLSKEDKEMYDISLKRKWDNHGALTYAREEGLEIGRQEGRQEGKHEQAIEFARELKKDGAPLELIIRYTKLTAEEIEKLK